MEEALETDRLALVGKIKGRNPTLGKMKEWARTNWTGLQGEGPVITPLAKGWFGFWFRCKEDVDIIRSRV